MKEQKPSSLEKENNERKPSLSRELNPILHKICYECCPKKSSGDWACEKQVEAKTKILTLIKREKERMRG